MLFTLYKIVHESCYTESKIRNKNAFQYDAYCRGSSCQPRGSASVHDGIHPPGCGPGNPLPGCGPRDPLVWAWRLPLVLGLETSPARPLKLPFGCGPGDLQDMLIYQPPTPGDLQGMLGYQPPMDRRTRVKT